MKLVKHISAILFGMIFLVSSSGFLIYKSNCFCTGNEQVSVFVKSEICTSGKNMESKEDAEMSCCSSKILIEEDNPAKSTSYSSKEKDKAEETLTCKKHSTDCDKTEVTYLKLKNKVLNEEVKFTKVEPIVLMVLHRVLSDVLDVVNFTAVEIPYVDPPPLQVSSLDFLIQIQQLKIPAIA